MSRSKRRRYDAEFKRNAISLAEEQESPGIAGMPMFLMLNKPNASGNLSFSFK